MKIRKSAAVGAAVTLGLGAAALGGLEALFRYGHRRRPQVSAADRGDKLDPLWQRYYQMVAEAEDWIAERPVRSFSVKSFDGLTLRGMYIPAQRPRACMLLFHGYRSGGLRDFGPLIPFYHSQGLSVLVADQRACGRSDGDYIGFGALERRDAQTWAQYMDRYFQGQLPLVLEGVSLGASTVMMAAALELPASVRGIIADCGFTSPWDIIAHCVRLWYHVPPFPVVHLLSAVSKVRLGFGYKDVSTLDALSRSRLPLLLLHGGKDDFVPTYMTQLNYAAAAGPKRKVIVEEAGHGLSYLLEMERCQRELLRFLDELLEEGHGQ